MKNNKWLILLLLVLWIAGSLWWYSSNAEASGVYSASSHIWEIIVILLGTVVLGYFLQYSKPQAAPEKITSKTLAASTPEINEWEAKYKSFQANYEQNKTEWLQKNKSSEDRAKTFQAQLAEIKTQYEKVGVEKAEAASKLRVMETQRNEALENAKKVGTELEGASENIKALQEKINTLASALAMANSVKRETPKPIIISDEDLTKKYEADFTALKKQLEEKDKRVISLLSKEAAANELQLRNDKLASENKILRNEMSAGNQDADTAILKAQQLKDLQLQVLSLSNKIALANGETANVKKQLAEQQKRHHQQAAKLNELRMAIGQERNNMKAKIEALENELAPFKPVPEVVATPAEQTIEVVEPVDENEKTAPVTEQTVTNSPEIDATPTTIDVPTPLVQDVLPAAKTEVVTPKAFNETVAPTTFPADALASTEPVIENQPIFPIDYKKITLPENGEETPFGKHNDLLLVQGIDVKVKELLETAGIDNWSKLAKTSPATLQTILSKKDGGDDFTSINPKSWPIQAQLLADGKWDAFSSYTKYLIGGVDPAEVRA